MLSLPIFSRLLDRSNVYTPHLQFRSALPLALAACLVVSIPRAGFTNSVIMYQQTDLSEDRPVYNLRVTDVYLPQTIRIEWAYDNMSTRVTPTFEVKRTINGVTTTLGTSITDKFYVDAFSFPYNTDIQYTVRVSYDTQDDGLPPPPACADPSTIEHLKHNSGVTVVGIHATVVNSTATDNQTVDSRYDLRYSAYVYKDFQFKTGIYRGGLYAGNQNDGSRVGRSFLKFQLSSLPSGQDLWCGSVNAFYTRSYSNGSTTVGCQKASPSTWDGQTLKWTTAPTITPANASQRVTVSYDGSDSSAKWCHWSVNGDIATALFNGGLVTFALASTDETATGWAYFTKISYGGGSVGSQPAPTPPSILYAYGGPLWPIDLTLNPTTVPGGQSSTGTVTLSGPAPTGGALVTLTSSNTSRATVPASVTIPAGQLGATFTVNTTSSYMAATVTITASYGGLAKTATLTVKGYF